MVTIKNKVLTAIYFLGIDQTKQMSNILASEFRCSKRYILGIIKQVETNKLKSYCND